MATIHIHLHGGMFGSKITDAFEENKHARQGGQFASTNGPGGGGATNRPATGAAAFAAKHNPAAKAAAAKSAAGSKGAGENAQEKLDKSRREQPLL